MEMLVPIASHLKSFLTSANRMRHTAAELRIDIIVWRSVYTHLPVNHLNDSLLYTLAHV